MLNYIKNILDRGLNEGRVYYQYQYQYSQCFESVPYRQNNTNVLIKTLLICVWWHICAITAAWDADLGALQVHDPKQIREALSQNFEKVGSLECV